MQICDARACVNNRVTRYRSSSLPQPPRPSQIPLGNGLAQCGNTQVVAGLGNIAQGAVLNIAITLSRLAKRGYEAMLDHYQKVAPHLNPGSRTGQACAVVYETRLVYPERSRRVQWCERRNPSPQGGGAGYSIVPSCFFGERKISFMPLCY